MNKEQQELVDEAYDRYCNTSSMYIPIWSQEQFINKCKTNTEFSEKWGLKIEERELSLEERIVIKNSKNIFISKGYIDDNGYLNDIGRLKLDKLIPTKLITLKYNEQTIESYE